MKRARDALPDDALPDDDGTAPVCDVATEAMMERLELLKRSLRKRGVDTMLEELPAKVAQLEGLSLQATVSVSEMRDACFALISMANALHSWLALSQSCVHEGDFVTTLLDNLKRLLTHVSASGASLINALQSSLAHQGDIRVTQSKKATTAEHHAAFDLAHTVSVPPNNTEIDCVYLLVTDSSQFAVSAVNLRKWLSDVHACNLLLLDLMEKNVEASATTDFVAESRPFGRAAHHTRSPGQTRGAGDGRRSRHQQQQQQQQQRGKRYLL